VSRAKAVAERNALDFYSTPVNLAHEIVKRIAVEEGTPGHVIEPSAGHGAFVGTFKEVWPYAKVTAIDIDPAKVDVLLGAGADTAVEADWRRYAPMVGYSADRTYIIGNPPYREAEEHIRAAIEWMRPRERLFFLLRLNFLGSLSRIPFWKEHPAAWVAPIVPRPSFTGGGTDGTEYAVFAWYGGGSHEPTELLPPIRWEP
jgi:hypothetical protein